MKAEAHVLLPAGQTEVWGSLIAWESQPGWMVDAERVGILTPEHEGTGVRVAVRTRVLGLPMFTEVLEVVEWDAPRRLVMAHRSFVRGTGQWALEPVAGVTNLRWTEELSLPIPVLGELLLALYRPVLTRLMRRSLENLRRGFLRKG